VGGEEFLILLPNAGAGEAVDLGERLRIELRRSGTGPEPVFTVSLGVAEGSCADDLSAVIGAADRALFAAKAAGRDRVVSSHGPAAAPSGLPLPREAAPEAAPPAAAGRAG
jgi:diguanylate cyclase (GGDEF)-like protein